MKRETLEEARKEVADIRRAMMGREGRKRYTARESRLLRDVASRVEKHGLPVGEALRILRDTYKLGLRHSRESIRSKMMGWRKTFRDQREPKSGSMRRREAIQREAMNAAADADKLASADLPEGEHRMMYGPLVTIRFILGKSGHWVDVKMTEEGWITVKGDSTLTVRPLTPEAVYVRPVGYTGGYVPQWAPGKKMLGDMTKEEVLVYVDEQLRYFRSIIRDNAEQKQHMVSLLPSLKEKRR